MIVTDVLQPRVPRARRGFIGLIALFAVALIGVPIYQGASSGLGGSTEQATGAFGPRLQLTVDREVWSSGEVVGGILAVTAPDGASLQGPAVISIYPAGAPQTTANRVASVQVAVPARVPADGILRIPLTIATTGLRAGAYNANVELGAEVEKGDLHAVMKTIATAQFTIE